MSWLAIPRSLFLLTALIGLGACGKNGDRPGSLSTRAFPGSPTAPAAPVTPAMVWLTYTNTQYGYEFQYPSDWRISGGREPQPGDDFEAQSVELTNGADRVLVAVNFQGGWCEASRQPEKKATGVSSVSGIEF